MTPLLLVPWMVAALACPPSQANAQPPGKQPEAKVDVTVVVILASERCKCIDPRLKDMACELQRVDAGMTGFRLVSMAQLALPANQKTAFACVEDAVVHVLVKQCADADGWVCLAVTEPGKAEIDYRTVCGKYFPIITGYRVKEHVPPMGVGQAFCQALAGGAAAPLLAVNTLLENRCRARLVIAICVQPCKGK
jgi:hypothetical protein